MIGRIARPLHPGRSGTKLLPLLLGVYALLAAGFCARLFALPAARVLNGNLPAMGGDFLALSIGGRIVREGNAGRLYDLAAQTQAQAAILGAAQVGSGEPAPDLALFVYPPFVALGFAALAGLPPFAAYLAWLAFNLALLGLAIAALAGLAGEPHARGRAALVLVLAAASFLPAWSVLTRGQMSFLVLAVLAAALLALRHDRDFLAGLCLALGMVKPQLMLVPLIVLLFTRRWRALSGLALGSLVLGGLALLAVGPEGVAQYLRLLAQAGNETGPDSLVHPLYMFNWRGTAIRLVTWLFGTGNNSGTALVLGASAVLSLLTLLGLLWAWRGGRRAEQREQAGLWALTILAAMLVSPHLHEYDLCLWLLAGALITAQARPRGEAPYWLAAAHVMPLATIILGQALRAQVSVLVTLALAVLAWRVSGGAGRLACPRER